VARFSISHTVRRLRQPSPGECWTAAIAMARGQLRGQRLMPSDVRELASRAGVRLEWDGSLPTGDVVNTYSLSMAVLLRLCDLRTGNLTMQRMRTLLGRGPLVILGAFNYPSRGVAQNHAITVYRFVGDDTDEVRTTISLVDPYDARTFDFSWASFSEEFLAAPDFILHR
jgi:hypothetical protein